LLSTIGAILALPLALRASVVIANLLWTGAVPLTIDLRPDLRVLAFATAVTAITGILVGVCAAYHAAKQNPAEALSYGRTISGHRSRAGIDRILICTQVALALILTSGAGLLTRSLVELRSTNAGFQADDVLVLWLSPTPGGYKDLDKAAYYRALLSNLSDLPGVQSVTLSHTSPTFYTTLSEPVAALQQDSEATVRVPSYRHTIAPRFFDTFGMSLREGRDFTPEDAFHAPPVAILSARLARQLFASHSAVGQRIRLGASSEQTALEVVGVVSDASLFNIRLQNPNAFYVPFFQAPSAMSNPLVQLRLGGGSLSSAFANTARKQVNDLGHEYVWRTQTLSEQVDQSIVEERLLGALSSVFGIVALLLAAIGIFGLISYSVNHRTREIGVRIALGADRKMIFRLVMGDSMRLTLIGIAIGFIVTLASTRLIAHMLFGISTTDPLTLLLAIGTMIAVALLAAYIPARRATKVDPMTALRHE
jgi:predicted permease